MSKSVKLPLIQKMLESKIFGFSLLLAGFSFIGFILFNGAQSFANIQKPVEEVSEYENLEAKETVGMEWARSIIEENEYDIELNQNTAPRPPYTYQTCKYIDGLDANLKRVYAGSGEHNVMVQVYAPGTAHNAFNAYKENFENCWNVESRTEGSPETEVITYGDGKFAFTYGDAIVFADNHLDYYLKEISNSLVASQCVALTVNDTDINRNAFANSDNYTGWIVPDSITYDDPILYESTIAPERHVFGEATQPEAPLPTNAPKLPENTGLTAPEFTEQEKKSASDFTEKITYRTPDPNGPGCGWAWSSYKQLTENEKEIIDAKKAKIEATQAQVDSNVNAYLAQQDKATIDNLFKLSELVRWNDYADQVTEVHKYWWWLEAEREQFKPTWDSYIANYKQWLINTDNYDEAVKQYEKDLEEYEQCLANFEEEEPVEEPTTDPTDDPSTDPTDDETTSEEEDNVSRITQQQQQAQLECVKPVEPSNNAEEPEAPTPPEGVTIPNSWDKIDDITLASVKAEVAERERIARQAEEERQAEAERQRQAEEEQEDSQNSNTSPNSGRVVMGEGTNRNDNQ